MLFDTHAHLNDPAFDPDRESLMAGLAEKGIGFVMNAGCSLESSRDIVAMADRYPWLYASVGSHPDSAAEVCEEVLEEYRKLCKLNPKIKAIGEIGLDYHYEDIPRDIQLKAFRMQMELARELVKRGWYAVIVSNRVSLTPSDFGALPKILSISPIAFTSRCSAEQPFPRSSYVSYRWHRLTPPCRRYAVSRSS